MAAYGQALIVLPSMARGHLSFFQLDGSKAGWS